MEVSEKGPFLFTESRIVNVGGLIRSVNGSTGPINREHVDPQINIQKADRGKENIPSNPKGKLGGCGVSKGGESLPMKPVGPPPRGMIERVNAKKASPKKEEVELIVPMEDPFADTQEVELLKPMEDPFEHLDNPNTQATEEKAAPSKLTLNQLENKMKAAEKKLELQKEILEMSQENLKLAEYLPQDKARLNVAIRIDKKMVEAAQKELDAIKKEYNAAKAENKKVESPSDKLRSNPEFMKKQQDLVRNLKRYGYEISNPHDLDVKDLQDQSSRKLKSNIDALADKSLTEDEREDLQEDKKKLSQITQLIGDFGDLKDGLIKELEVESRNKGKTDSDLKMESRTKRIAQGLQKEAIGRDNIPPPSAKRMAKKPPKTKLG